MLNYRACLIGPDGGIQSRAELMRIDDDALEHAMQLMDGYEVELWQLDRKTAVFAKRQC